MSEKGEDDYLKLIKHLDILPKEFMMIGNSLKSDVIPVLNIGGHAIHVPYHTTWAHEQVEAKLDHDNFRHVERFERGVGVDIVIILGIKICRIQLDISSAHSRGGLVTFCRHKSNQKGFQQKGFFAAQGLCPANQPKPRAAKCCPTSFALAHASANIAMPLPAHMATIVLPDFARSCSADGNGRLIKVIILIVGQNEKRVVGLTEKRAKVFCLCGWKLFSVLIFGYFPSKGK